MKQNEVKLTKIKTILREARGIAETFLCAVRKKKFLEHEGTSAFYMYMYRISDAASKVSVRQLFIYYQSDIRYTQLANTFPQEK